MSILSRCLHTVSYFIFCIAFLFSIGCKKQALEGLPPTAPLPTTNTLSVPSLLSNSWGELSRPVFPEYFFSINIDPFVVNDNVYVNTASLLYRYDSAGKTWILEDTDQEFLYGNYLFSYQSKAYYLKWHTIVRAYDVNTHTWTDKADFPGLSGSSAANVTTATKGYVMGGQGINSNGNVMVHAENWEYNFVSDTWTKKANTPGFPRHFARSFAVGNKIYFGTGQTLTTKVEFTPLRIYTEPMLLEDWWEYNTNTNTWTRKADFPGGPRIMASGFVLNDKVYAGAGQQADWHDQMFDLWQYDPISNTWQYRRRYPITPDEWNTISYVGTSSAGYGLNSDFEEFWRYFP